MKHPKIILNITYYIALILIIITTMLCYNYTYIKNIYLPSNDPTSITIYTIIIWYVILTFPLSFKGFSLAIKHLKKLPDDGSREHYYKIYGVIRIIIMTIGFIASIIGFYLLQQKSLIWLAGISAIGLIICKPTEKKIDTDLEGLTTKIEDTEKEDTINTNK